VKWKRKYVCGGYRRVFGSDAQANAVHKLGKVWSLPCSFRVAVQTDQQAFRSGLLVEPFGVLVSASLSPAKKGGKSGRYDQYPHFTTVAIFDLLAFVFW